MSIAAWGPGRKRMKIENKIEIAKVIIGLLVTCVAGLWTLSVFIHEQDRRTDDAVARANAAINQAFVDCHSVKLPLLSVISSLDAVRAESPAVYQDYAACLKSFNNLRNSVSEAEIRIERPLYCREFEWRGLWSGLDRALQTTLQTGYETDETRMQWVKIVRAIRNRDCRI